MALLVAGLAVAVSLLARQALLLPTGSLALVEPAVGTRDARTEGVLEVTDECVRLHVPNGKVQLVIWVRGSVTWSEADNGIVYTSPEGDERILHDGDHVVLGGHGGEMDELDGAGWWVRRPAPGCVADGWWFASEVEAE